MVLLLLAIGAIAGSDRGDAGDDDVATGERPAAGPTTTPQGFEGGTWLVHDEIAPGLYAATGLGACYWERLRGPRGGIVANDNVSGQAIVEIAATDVAFNSVGCGRWVRFVAPPSPADSFGEGDHVVNAQIRPGRYRSEGGSRCAWERLRDFRGEGRRGVIAAERVAGPAVVEIAPTDAAFSSSGCGSWRRVA
jgi:hypothetical protein